MIFWSENSLIKWEKKDFFNEKIKIIKNTKNVMIWLNGAKKWMAKDKKVQKKIPDNPISDKLKSLIS